MADSDRKGYHHSSDFETCDNGSISSKDVLNVKTMPNYSEDKLF